MANTHNWVLDVETPFGEERYFLEIGESGEGKIKHPKGEVSFAGATVTPESFHIVANTEIPMTTTIGLFANINDDILHGIVQIGNFAMCNFSGKRG
jgi:hypothetical protein